MTDVDPRDFIDFYQVAVKPSAYASTTLSQEIFDEESNQTIYSTEIYGDELIVEFTSEQAAEKFVEELNKNIKFMREGFLNLRSPHPNDSSDVDAYLSFSGDEGTAKRHSFGE